MKREKLTKILEEHSKELNQAHQQLQQALRAHHIRLLGAKLNLDRQLLELADPDD